ncbi:MAG: AI-2E family transporter [Janthinobacterium lividum]
MPLDDATPTPPAAVPAMPVSGLGALNAGAVVVAALYLGRDLFVPLVLAVLLAFVLAPAVGLLQRARLGQVLSVVLAVLLAFAVIGGVGLVVGRQMTQLARSLPGYQATIQDKMRSLRVGGEVIERLSGGVQRLVGTAAQEGPAAVLAPGGGLVGGGRVAVVPLARVPGVAAAPEAAAVPAPAASGVGLDGGSALVVVRSVLQPLLSPLATAGIVVVFVIFVLLYRGDLRDRLIRLVGRQDLHRTILAMNDAASRLSRFFLTQVAINTAFGCFIGLGLWLLGLPNPVLWGILAGLMRFVPFIGTFVAVVPPLLLALAVVSGWSMAVWVLLLFVLGEMVMGQVIEPLLYGHSTGLSPVAIIVAAAFWTFLWGPIGLLLATPLTVCLVVLGRHVEALAFLDVMLGDRAPLDPPESFYQRALEGNRRGLATDALGRMRGHSLAEYYDQVALPGLALAQADLSSDKLEFERLDSIHQQIEALLGQLAARAASGLAAPAARGGPFAGLARARRARKDPRAAAASAAAAGRAVAAMAPAAWAGDGSVLCIPGRGQLDDLAATMAAQVLRLHGFGAAVEPNASLGAGAARAGGPGAVRLCCLCVLEEGSTPSSIRYFLRRIRRTMPDATVIVGLWHAAGGSPMLAALRAEGPGETIVTSLGEAVALCLALAARPAALVAE